MTELETAQAMLVKLEKAYYSGVLTVSSGDNQVKYQSMADMLTAISVLKAKIEGIAGTGSRAPRYLYQSGKGL